MIAFLVLGRAIEVGESVTEEEHGGMPSELDAP